MPRTFSIDADAASEYDEADPLARFRDRFSVPDDVYLDGNSLGPLSEDAVATLERAVEQWRTLGIRAWTEADPPWFEYGERLGDRLAPHLGARAGEVVAANSTTVNVHTLLGTVLDAHDGPLGSSSTPSISPPTTTRSAPSCASAVSTRTSTWSSSRVATGGPSTKRTCSPPWTPKTLASSSSPRSSTGAASASTSSASPPPTTGACSRASTSHTPSGSSPTTSTTPASISRSGVTTSTSTPAPAPSRGCTSTSASTAPRQRSPAGGATRRPPSSNCARPSPRRRRGRLAARHGPRPRRGPLFGALDVLDEAGIDAVREGSLDRTAYLMALVDEHLADTDYRVGTPRAPERRGGHVAVEHPDADRIAPALRDRGVIVDYRPPNVLRLAPAPLYVGYEDLFETVAHLADVVATGAHEAYGDGDGVT